MTCPVCESGELQSFQRVKDTVYSRCPVCEATVMDPAHWLTPEQEREIYDLHDNHPDDPGYRRFLSKLTVPLLERLPEGAHGLDFGCGPGPALARMMEAAGMSVSLYDPFFHPEPTALDQCYDFVTCTEVVEHLHRPHEVFLELNRLLKPGGLLGVMTCFQNDDSKFANWHYRRDPTHVVFYREATMAWLADSLEWTMEVPVKDVVLFRKP
ncbi:methyltransferase-like protein [Marinobacter lipolyticus SM19]|uniref:Methyltransferase-like protein n=1 Tax=Marinobacter lipolyticus SM19 TaxID=1318628 RepID=R8AZ49_9GAMM|nr:class I SAM-dependent methyltransferase [Marinobacter lipolyticus]EON91610.1 methyltransferase-like protein [Marinobacter lipolyticus SM19]